MPFYRYLFDIFVVSHLGSGVGLRLIALLRGHCLSLTHDIRVLSKPRVSSLCWTILSLGPLLFSLASSFFTISSISVFKDGTQGHQYHPIDSLYTVESVKDTVPVIEHIFGAKYVR